MGDTIRMSTAIAFKMRFLCIYSLVLVQIMTTLVNADGTIIVVDLANASLWTGPVDTLELVKIPLEDVLNPVAVDYDPVEQKVYWTDVRRNTISRAFLNGTEQEVVVSFLSVPDGVSIDSENRHIYWTDTGTNKIERSNLDGRDRTVVLEADLDQPRAIVVDPAAEHIYWTDWGEDPKIERASLEGNDRLILVSTGLHLPNGLAIDFDERRLYWCDAGLNKIETTDLYGGDRRLLFQIAEPDIHPFDIGIYMNNIYWSDWAFTKLIRMDKYAGLQAEAVGPAVFARAGGLHIHQDHDGSCSSHRCLNGGRCRQLIQGYQCACLPGYTGEFCAVLDQDINQCDSNPCLNGGQCLDGQLKYVCNCETTGWQGNMCEIDTDECVQSPTVCHASATCTNNDGGYTCECRTGFVGDGRTCTASVYPCLSNPCYNGGQCFTGTTGSDFSCRCSPDYGGVHCTERVTATSQPTTQPVIVKDINECAQIPSVCHAKAICTNSDGSYTCECQPEYIGDGVQCIALTTPERPAPCDSQPCLNGGVCSYIEDILECQCQMGFTGQICEKATVTPATEPYGCQHPGDLENGYVIPDKPDGGQYPAGKKVEYLCMDGYDIDGRKDVYCQSDFTWSHDRPKCVADVPTLDLRLVIGTGVPVGVVIIILIAILIFVCRRESPRPNTEGPLVSYNTQIPKDDGKVYDRALDTAGQPNPVYAVNIIPSPHPSSAATLNRQSNHIYAEVEIPHYDTPRYPPTYLSVIANDMNDEDPENPYAHMRGGVRVDR